MSMTDVTYSQALASLKIVDGAGIVDLTDDDYNFLIGDKLWIAADRSRVRRVVEATVYGSLDLIGLPRFPAPAEFIAAAIAFYVHPKNIQYACSELSNAEWSLNIINGIDQPLSAQQLFAHTIRIKSGILDKVDSTFRNIKHASMAE